MGHESKIVDGNISPESKAIVIIPPPGTVVTTSEDDANPSPWGVTVADLGYYADTSKNYLHISICGIEDKIEIWILGTFHPIR